MKWSLPAGSCLALMVSVGLVAACSSGVARPNSSSSTGTSGGSSGTTGGSGGGLAGGAGGVLGGGAGGTGGLAGTAGAGGAAGTGGAAVCPTDPNLVTSPNGWVGCDPALTTDNPMGIQGALYMFGDGSSCTETPMPCGPNGCCISGNTAVDPTFAKWGCGLGLELNATGGDASVKQIYSGPMKCFDITLSGNTGGNTVRVSYTQAADMTNKVAPFIELDPITSTWSGTICIDDVACPNWESMPDCSIAGPYDLQLQVNGGTLAAAYNLCMTSLIPHDGTGAGLTTLKQLCAADEETTGGGYLFRNNVWGNGGAQCITAKAGGGLAAFTVDSASHNVSTGTPAAYPSIVKGWNWGAWTDGSGLPKTLGTLVSATTSVNFTLPSSGGRYNASYDLWVAPTADPDTPAGGLEVMIWLAYQGAQPLGGKVDTIDVGGVNWDVWSGTNDTWQYLAYVRQGNTTSFNGDLKPFLDDARSVERGKAQATDNLLSIQFGFEIWESAPGFAVNSFSATVN